MERGRANLLVLGEREALAWVLAHERMAFPPVRAREAEALAPGDLLLLYATRGCFHNPTRDRGRVIGRARVRSEVRTLRRPIALAGRTFTTGCDIAVEALAPFGEGVELAPIVERLTSFPDKRAWSARMRRPLVSFTDKDAALLLNLLAPRERELASARSTYLARSRSKAA